MQIRLKRAYEPVAEDDGTRILVDRLWPRGVSKQALRIDHWLKDLAPGRALRQWFGHDPTRWNAFRATYHRELATGPEGLETLRDAVSRGPVTLIYAARDSERNNAVALKQFLELAAARPDDP